MYSELEVYVHAGPMSLLAMSQLDWEKHLIGGPSAPESLADQVSLHMGPIELRLRSARPVSARTVRPPLPGGRATEGVAS